jgi:hypothetical protein
MYLQKLLSQKTVKKTIFLLESCQPLTKKKDPDLIPNLERKSVVLIRGSGSGPVPKCHGFTTLLLTLAAVTQNQSRVNTLVNPCRLSGNGVLPLCTIVNTQFLITSKMFNPIFKPCNT